MTSRKAPLFGALLVLAIAIDVGVACSSTSDTTLPPPPGSSSGSTSSSSSGSPDAGQSLCSIGVSLNLPLCLPCNNAEISAGGACGALSMSCLDDPACLGAAMCVGKCDDEGGADKLSCVEGCLGTAPADYADYITCIGAHCSDCNTPGIDCMISDGGAQDGDAAIEGGMCEAETDVGCGGANCPQCGIGQKCKANSDCVGNTCTADVCACPTGMISVPISGGGGHFCVDATEVTYTQYQAFYSANPALTQPQACIVGMSYTPSSNWPAAPAEAAQPVRYVSWCQAADYCLWAGKRLCGMIGGGSVSIAGGDTMTPTNPSFDQWYNACSAQGGNLYPYGNTYSPTLCNGQLAADGGSMGPWSQTQNMTCIGGEPGVFDMSGNVAEWEDACDAYVGPNDNCLVRGGSYLSGETQLECGSLPTQMRSYQGPDVGFRCCL